MTSEFSKIYMCEYLFEKQIYFQLTHKLNNIEGKEIPSWLSGWIKLQRDQILLSFSCGDAGTAPGKERDQPYRQS